MEALTTLKLLQQKYQAKFAELIALHNSKDPNGLQSPEYFKLREEWIQAGNEIRLFLEKISFTK